ncbi:MAG: hypothetical protein WCJ09_18935 [Planctomycetota bacterium]
MFNTRSSVVHWLWTNNPFYFISALLMLYAVRATYGQLEIGAINCWVMMGVLAGYTSLLAFVGIAIVRWGGVWDDARSILLLLLLMFLAVSVSADDLFVQMESSSGAVALLGIGLAFSTAVIVAVLRCTGIRLGRAFLLPFFLFLALFYVTPWWCSPELHPRSSSTLDWTIFLFPQVAALLCLTLLPAVRRGKDYFANNGTPWAWPVFPWVAFGAIAVAVILRSYALTLTFSQTGPIWSSPDVRQGIVLDTIWRPYFIAPFLLAVLLLVLEGGLAHGNLRLARKIMQFTPLLLLLAWPHANTLASADFASRVSTTIGSQVWLMTLLLIAFYAWGVIRRAPLAIYGLLGSISLLTWIGPSTISTDTFVMQPLPLFAVSLILVGLGLYRSSTPMVLAASAVVATGFWFALPDSGFRATLCYHTILMTAVLLSLFQRDRLSLALRQFAAVWLPISAVIVLVTSVAGDVPLPWRFLYVAALAVTCAICAQVCQSRLYWGGFIGTTTVMGYGLISLGFRSATSLVGWQAMTAFSWSVGSLMIAAMISAYKARWLPQLTMATWMTGPEILQNVDSPPEVHGTSATD